MKKRIFLLFVLISIIFVQNNLWAQATNNTYGPIKSGDVLWKIAGKVRPDKSLSHYQVMLALLKANPQAFHTSCNLNTLKVGQMLQIPSRTEMQALTHTQAVKEFNRQLEEWKTSRKQGQPIVCPPLESKKKPILSLIKEALAPPTTPTTESQNLVNLEEERKREIEKRITESTFTPTTLEDNVPLKMDEDSFSWLSQFLVTSNLLLITIGILVIITVFFLVFLIGQRLSQWFSKRSAQKGFPKSKLSTSPPHQTHQKDPEEIKNKLAQVRSYLAEDSTQITQKILREVIQNGTSEQQIEAKQLYEITKKMNQFKKNTPEKQQMTTPQSDEPDNWPEIREKPWPVQQYLPENKEQLFGLIDKIFEFLDYELNAQGQLIEAYANRHQREFFKSQNYEIVEPPEKVVISDDKEKPLRKPQAEVKPTRYL
jgi:FimV-like protein